METTESNLAELIPILNTLDALGDLLENYVHEFKCTYFSVCPVTCDEHHTLDDFTAILWNMAKRIEYFYYDDDEQISLGGGVYDLSSLVYELTILVSSLFYHHSQVASALMDFLRKDFSPQKFHSKDF